MVSLSGYDSGVNGMFFFFFFFFFYSCLVLKGIGNISKLGEIIYEALTCTQPLPSHTPQKIKFIQSTRKYVVSL